MDLTVLLPCLNEEITLKEAKEIKKDMENHLKELFLGGVKGE